MPDYIVCLECGKDDSWRVSMGVVYVNLDCGNCDNGVRIRVNITITTGGRLACTLVS